MIVWKKGYQEFDQVESVVTTKVKGVVYTNFTNHSIPDPANRLWDVPDYVIPPQVSTFSVFTYFCTDLSLFPKVSNSYVRYIDF